MRGQPLFVLSMFLQHLDPMLRKTAELGAWQVHSSLPIVTLAFAWSTGVVDPVLGLLDFEKQEAAIIVQMAYLHVLPCCMQPALRRIRDWSA